MVRVLPPDADLGGVVRPGARIVLGHGCGEPLALSEALVAQRADLGPLTVFMASAFSSTFQPEHADLLRIASMGAIGSLGGLARAGALDIIPCHVGQIGRFLTQGRIGCDVALVQLSAPGPDGSYSLGLINDHIQAAVDKAEVVIAEVNHRVPWTRCDRNLTDEDLDWVLETSRQPVEAPSATLSDLDHAIAAQAAAWIDNGSVLQMGIGAVPEAITRLLGDRRDLGVHSGMIGEGIMALMEAGVVTNARKRFDQGITVTGALIGTERLFRFADRNPAIGMRRAETTHGEAVLGQIPRLVSINSAVEVDLTGQVNAEQTGDHYLGATGGQVDYVRGGSRSPGGRSIIALPATARKGAISRIVSRLSGPVTTARSEVDIIVTEFGAAELRGRPIRERVRAMVAIAHPDFRAGLEREAHDLLKRGF